MPFFSSHSKGSRVRSVTEFPGKAEKKRRCRPTYEPVHTPALWPRDRRGRNGFVGDTELTFVWEEITNSLGAAAASGGEGVGMEVPGWIHSVGQGEGQCPWRAGGGGGSQLGQRASGRSSRNLWVETRMWGSLWTLP